MMRSDARRDARKAAVALVGAGRHVDGIGEGAGERLEALAILAGLGHRIEGLFGPLDQLARAVLDVGIEGLVDQFRTHPDELPALRQLIDGAAIFLGVDDGGGAGREPRQIGGAADFLQGRVVLEVGLERHRARQLADLDQRRSGLEDARVQRLEKMLRQQKGRDLVAGFVVDQDGAEQRLFRLQVVGRGAIALVVRGRIDSAEGRVLIHRVTVDKCRTFAALLCKAIYAYSRYPQRGPCRGANFPPFSFVGLDPAILFIAGEKEMPGPARAR